MLFRSFQSNAFWTSNSPLKGNVVVWDAATTNAYVNSINTANIAVNAVLTTTTPVFSNTIIDQGQYTVFSTYASGGTGPYTYNFLVFNAVSNTDRKSVV